MAYNVYMHINISSAFFIDLTVTDDKQSQIRTRIYDTYKYITSTHSNNIFVTTQLYC